MQKKSWYYQRVFGLLKLGGIFGAIVLGLTIENAIVAWSHGDVRLQTRLVAELIIAGSAFALYLGLLYSVLPHFIPKYEAEPPTKPFSSVLSRNAGR